MTYKKSIKRREEILSVAAQLFSEKGYYATEIKEIADRMGISHPGIYYYFKNKKEIALELYNVEIAKVYDYMNKMNEKEDISPLCLCIMQSYLVVKKVALNPSTTDFFCDMIVYRDYPREEMLRVCRQYYGFFSNLFATSGKTIEDDDFIAYVLASDAYSKALLLGIRKKILSYTIDDAIDHYYRQLLLAELEIPFSEYLQEKEIAFSILKENGQI